MSKQSLQRRNKEESKQVILDTAIKLLKEEGLKSFSMGKLAQESGKSRRLIYNYFGGTEDVLRAVLQKSDFWLALETQLDEVLKNRKDNGNTLDLATLVFSNHCETFQNDPLVQEISALELTHSTDSLTHISDSRERVGEKLFEVAEPDFEGTDISIRMVSALLIGGINYMLLHNKMNDSTFCGLNLDQDFPLLKKTVSQIIGWAYSHTEDK